MNEPTIQHVSDPAFLIAQCRAVESARADALFHDPLAARLAGEKGRVILEDFPRGNITCWVTAIRTVVIDDFIREAVANGTTTVVNLGAGLDTRPYRLDLPRTIHWIEADYPKMIEYKEALLGNEVPYFPLERFGVDLSDAAARRAFLAMIDARGGNVLVLTEGVVPYLDLDQAAALAVDLRAMSHVDGWIVDFISPRAHERRDRGKFSTHMREAPFKFRPADWLGFFRECGWDMREIRYLAIEGIRLGREFPIPGAARIVFRVMRPFLRRRSREGMLKFAGYAVMVPTRAG
jgi:methyltransferase (TIGR00027 family)